MTEEVAWAHDKNIARVKELTRGIKLSEQLILEAGGLVNRINELLPFTNDWEDAEVKQAAKDVGKAGTILYSLSNQLKRGQKEVYSMVKNPSDPSAFLKAADSDNIIGVKGLVELDTWLAGEGFVL